MNAWAISNDATAELALGWKSVDLGARLCTALREEPRNGQASVGPFIAKGGFMKWETPSFTDMRFGFEITMYIATR